MKEAKAMQDSSGLLIKKVRISNYRSLKNIEVELAPTTVLMGTNNSGKTAFLSALNLALGAGRKNVSKYDIFSSPSDLTDSKREAIIDICIVPTDSSGTEIDKFNDEWMRIFADDIVFNSDATKQSFLFRTKIVLDDLNEYSCKHFSLNKWETPPEKETSNSFNLKILDCLRSFFVDAHRDILSDLQNANSYWGKLSRNIDFEEDTKNELEKKIEDLSNELINGSSLLQNITEKLSQIKDMNGSSQQGTIQIVPLAKRVTDLNKSLDIYFQSNGSDAMPLKRHGMGTRSWSSILLLEAYLSWYKEKKSSFHSLLTVEEPEAHLHPQAQKQIFDILDKFWGQKIISTHSPSIISSCPLSSLLCFRKDFDQTFISNIDKGFLSDNPEFLRKIEREVLNTRGELLFSKAVVLVEGETEEQLLPILFEKCFQKASYIAGVNIVGVGGSGNYFPFIKILQDLNIPWLILSDYDKGGFDGVVGALEKLSFNKFSVAYESEDIKEQFNQYLKNNHYDEKVFMLSYGKNLEGYLIEQGFEDLLKNALKELALMAATNNEHHVALEKIWDDKICLPEELEKLLEKEKTSYAPIFAKLLCETDPKKDFPAQIQNLFKKLGEKMGG